MAIPPPFPVVSDPADKVLIPSRPRKVLSPYGYSASDRLKFTRPSRKRINSAATDAETRQATVAAEGSPIPIVYGRQRLGGMIFAATTSGTSLVLGVAWCVGEVQSVEQVLIDDTDASTISGVTVTSYAGANTQTADPTLAAAITDYADDLVITYKGTDYGIAYSVVVISTTADLSGFPRLEAIIQGTKCLEVSGGVVQATRSYSRNPGRALVDLLVSDYGMGLSADGAAVQNVIDACDATLADSSARREIDLAIVDTAEGWAHIDALTVYAGCILAREAGVIKPIADTTATSSRALTAANFPAGQSFTVRKRGAADTPTVVRVIYTDTTVTPWRDAPVVAKATGVDAGTVPWRESQISLPGITRKAQALREATERLNNFTLVDLELEWVTYDEGIQDLVGDVVTITHPIGLTAKDVRIVACDPLSPGRWAVRAVEYDAAVYSDSIESEPSTPDTTLPNPFDVPDLTGLTAVEEVYQLDNGTYSSRIRITWTATSTYPFNLLYDWRVLDGASVVYSGSTPDTVGVTGPVQEGVSYTIQARIRGITVSAMGAYAQTNLTAQGKQLAPSDVSSIMGFEVGGEVRLSWTAAVDIDIWRYEIRYGTTGGSWATATFIDRVDGLRLSTRDIPPGTWRFYVKALDSIGQYSANAATIDITVSLDSSAFFVGQQVVALSTSASSNVFEFSDRQGNTEAWTEVGTAVSTLFPTTASTYTDPFLAYDNAATSEWESDVWDVGGTYTGTWRAVVDAVGALGTGDAVTTYLEISPDNADWSDSSTVLSRNASSRYARIRVVAASGNTLHVDGDVSIRLDVVAREETGSGTSNTSRSALRFGGTSSDYIAIASNTNINSATSGYTAKTWEVRFITGTDVTSRQTIYEQGGDAHGLSVYIISGYCHVGFWVAGTFFTTSLKFVVVGDSYYHVIGRFDGSSMVVDGWVNGTHLGQVSATGLLSGHPDPIGIGFTNTLTRYHDTTATSSEAYLDGDVLSVRQYNRVVTDTEVLEHVQGVYSSTSGLVQLYDLTTGTGTTADDTSSTNNDATITGCSWVTVAEPEVITTTGAYDFLKSLQVQPLGSTPMTWSPDNIIMGDPTSFLVYIFTASGTQVAKDFTWRIEAI